ncbi:MAG: DEAD/DEAH box helicase [Zoogloeaceae bacterium]|jgi:SNF2 family DNA or RNA helicase|nr:DEAD/DEAH box helicase [Zoogloeaceae bacterium]
MTIKLYGHQESSVAFLADNNAVFDASDPGTGKTLAQIADFTQRLEKCRAQGIQNSGVLVVCPKSLMRAVWETEIKRYAPQITVAVADAQRRRQAMNSGADVLILNADGVKALANQPASWFTRFSTLVIDESEVFKHHTSQRSRAMRKIARRFPWRRCLSGTPNSNGICDVWHQYLLLDEGKRLGSTFRQFRNAACEAQPISIGGEQIVFQYRDRDGIEQVVADLVKDITLRHKLSDCVELPPMRQYCLEFILSRKHRALYDKFQRDSLLECRGRTISALNAATLAGKLLQTSSGTLYDQDGKAVEISPERYELIADLAAARKHSVVFYLWNHQRDQLCKHFQKAGVRHCVWEPGKPRLAEEFQAGGYQAMLAHPASAAHGLTLTRAASVIWASPTWNLTWFEQGNRRIFRIGQEQKTEVITVLAKDTLENKVWEQLQNKNLNLARLLASLSSTTPN